MFREMRRKAQSLPEADCLSILSACTHGTLAVSGDDGYPYAVPLSYACSEGSLYFHCAKTGHKLDAIARNDKVSFCVTSDDLIVPAEYTTYYRSVIVFGRARVLTDEAEIRTALRLLSDKYSPGLSEGAEHEIDQNLYRVAVVKLTIEHMTGKEATELMKQRSRPL